MNSIYRLKKSEVFQETFEKGAKNKFKNLFFINILENSKNKNMKIGIAVSKKFGHAPYRNRIKRQVRDILSKQELSKLDSHNYVFVFSKKFCELSYADKEKELAAYIKVIKNGNYKKQKEKKSK
ncbi:MAG: ribonuclease P protein component [Mycoplasmataceae bacterium]|nr:ribonuclease P protein component [Mycoplasmataceae bacterium]